VLVAQEGEHVVGFTACGVSQDEDLDRARTGEIYVIYVHPRAWRQRHGTALANQAIECLREEGFEEAILWVLEGNQQAMRFYESAGFEADGASKVKQRADGSEMPIVRFRRSIA
jgi:ribosomal protein S18 acetylase RimI-like enzyme